MLQSEEPNSAERLPSRRTNKPLVEKRRRERINGSLGELKSLLLQAMKQDGAQFSRLEKADILEMTVKYLKHVQRQQCATVMAANPAVAGKYRAGFTECAGEVMKYFNNANGVDTRIRENLNQHLTECLTVVNPTTTTNNVITHPSPSHIHNNVVNAQPSSPHIQHVINANSSPSHIQHNVINDHPSPSRIQHTPNGQSDSENQDCVLKPLNIQIPESSISSAYKQSVNGEGYLLMPIAHSTPVSTAVSSAKRVQQSESARLAGNENSKSAPQVQNTNNGLRCITNIYQSRFLNSDKEHAPHKAHRQMSTSPLTSKQTTLRQHPYSKMSVNQLCGEPRQVYSPPQSSFNDEKLWRPW